MIATVNNMYGLGLSFLYIDITPINPHSITSTPFNRYNRHYITAITHIKVYLDPKNAIGSSFLYM